jgi:hypothetical protein
MYIGIRQFSDAAGRWQAWQAWQGWQGPAVKSRLAAAKGSRPRFVGLDDPTSVRAGRSRLAASGRVLGVCQRPSPRHHGNRWYTGTSASLPIIGHPRLPATATRCRRNKKGGRAECGHACPVVFGQGGLLPKFFCQKMLLYYLDSPANSAFVVDGLSAVGGAHPGAEADFARPLDLRNLMWVMHDALSRYLLWFCRFPNSRVMIPARPPLDKRFLRQLFACARSNPG